MATATKPLAKMSAAPVLDFCNEIRREHGLDPVDELIRGKRADSFQCPIAHTIGFASDYRVSVTYETVWVYRADDKFPLNSKRVYPVPQAVADFMKEIDLRHFPELLYED